MRAMALGLWVVLSVGSLRAHAQARQEPASPPHSQAALVGTTETTRAAPALTDTAPVATSTPFYERWWFWASVAAAVCAVSIGVAVATTSSRPTDPPPGTPVPLGKPLLRW